MNILESETNTFILRLIKIYYITGQSYRKISGSPLLYLQLAVGGELQVGALGQHAQPRGAAQQLPQRAHLVRPLAPRAAPRAAPARAQPRLRHAAVAALLRGPALLPLYVWNVTPYTLIIE